MLFAGKIGFHRFGECAYILYKYLVSVLLGDEAKLACRFARFAVTDMIVGKGGKSVFRKECHKFVVSFYMLRHAVSDLKDRAHLTLGDVDLAIERVRSVGRKSLFFDYPV